MSDIPQYDPDQIIEFLRQRVTSTNNLWEKRDEDDIEQEKILFFKYYFDYSSAIEATLRSLVDQYCRHSLLGKSLKIFSQSTSSSVPFFLTSEEFASVTNETDILADASQTQLDIYLNDVCFMSKASSSERMKNFNDYELLKQTYAEIRRVRNILAHGIRSMGDNVDFSKTTLSKFIYVFYLTHNYYKRIYSNS